MKVNRESSRKFEEVEEGWRKFEKVIGKVEGSSRKFEKV